MDDEQSEVNAPAPVAEEEPVAESMEVDQPAAEEQAEQPAVEEPAKKPEDSPHAMETADFPENEDNNEPAEGQEEEEEDPDKSVAPSEKSMEQTLINNSAIDPFDTVKNTSGEQDTSMNEVTEIPADETSNLDATIDLPESEQENAAESTREGTPSRDEGGSPEPEKDDGPNEGKLSDSHSEQL